MTHILVILPLFIVQMTITNAILTVLALMLATMITSTSRMWIRTIHLIYHTISHLRVLGISIVLKIPMLKLLSAGTIVYPIGRAGMTTIAVLQAA
jgi:hypothetical protein